MFIAHSKTSRFLLHEIERAKNTRSFTSSFSCRNLLEINNWGNECSAPLFLLELSSWLTSEICQSPHQPKATRAIALSDAWWKAPKCINQWFILPFPSLIEVEFGSAPKANRLRLKGVSVSYSLSWKSARMLLTSQTRKCLQQLVAHPDSKYATA